MAAQLVLREREDVENLAVDIEQLQARRLALRERADSRDDLARPLAVGGDVVERRARFRHLGRLGSEPARAGGGAGDHRPQGLADLVDNRGGQLAQRVHAVRMRELGLQSTQPLALFLCTLALRNID